MSCRDSGAERDGKDEREVLGGGGQTEGSCADRLAANEAAEMQEGSFMVGDKRSLSVRAMACKQGPHGPTDDATCSNSVHLQFVQGLEFDVEPTRRWAGLLVGDLV